MLIHQAQLCQWVETARATVEECCSAMVLGAPVEAGEAGAARWENDEGEGAAAVVGVLGVPGAVVAGLVVVGLEPAMGGH